MFTENEKDHHWETTIVRGVVVSRVRVYHDLNEKSVIHRVDLIPLDMDGPRVITLETYASKEVSIDWVNMDGLSVSALESYTSEEVPIDWLELGDKVSAVVVPEPFTEFNDKGSRISTVYSAVKVLVEEAHEETSSHMGVIRKRTDAWYAKYMDDSLTEPDANSVFMTSGIDFLGIEDASDSASVSSSYSEKACGCGDETGLCGPPL